jgi:RNA-directed DNA polymerase
MPAQGGPRRMDTLSHIYDVKNFSDRRDKIEKKAKPSAIHRLYGKFRFYRNFVALETPIILTEGKTDSIYLKVAIRMLPSYHSRLGTVRDGKFFPTIRFLNYSRLVHDVMQLGGGAGDLKHLITGYRKT